jgi:peptidoglycan/xylan/chitin deacetylase (PgdA/CDA1 family)
VPPAGTGTMPQPATGAANPSGLAEPGKGGVAKPAGAAGGLKVLPWAGFKGAITFSFDDAMPTQQQNKAKMLALGVPFTWYLTSAVGNPKDPMYKEALMAGHELGNHTSTHAHNSGTNDAKGGQDFLMSQYSVVGYTLAAPYGEASGMASLVGGQYLVDRGVSDGLIAFDASADTLKNLPALVPNQGAGAMVFKGKVDAAVSQGKWQAICIHGFTGDTGGAYNPVDYAGWEESVKYAKTQDIWVGSMMDVAAYLVGGKGVKAAMPAADGDKQVYTWMLPKTFPPKRYVRVTVDGGTVSQDGKALPWNEHGYYEVSLDLGSLTISP